MAKDEKFLFVKAKYRAVIKMNNALPKANPIPLRIMLRQLSPSYSSWKVAAEIKYNRLNANGIIVLF